MIAVLNEVQGVEAMRVLPEGQRICATTPPKPRRGAKNGMPKGHGGFAPDAPIQECSGEAIQSLPKGHERSASPNPNEDVEASRSVPKGHCSPASPPLSDAAKRKMPKGQQDLAASPLQASRPVRSCRKANDVVP